MEQTHGDRERAESSAVFFPYSEGKKRSLWSRITSGLRRSRRGYQQIGNNDSEKMSRDDPSSNRKSRFFKRQQKYKKGSYDERSSYIFNEDESKTSRCSCFSCFVTKS